MHDLKVLIIGAEIGGLTAGFALRQAGFAVEIYDRVRELRPVGAGISLWSNGVKVLNRLGLGKRIAAIGGQMDRMEYRRQTGELMNEIDSCHYLPKSVSVLTQWHAQIYRRYFCQVSIAKSDSVLNVSVWKKIRVA